MSNHGWPEESDSDVIKSLIQARDTLERECHREHDKNVELTDRIHALTAELASEREAGLQCFQDKVKLEWRVKELELELDYASESEHGTFQGANDAEKALKAHRATK